MAKGEQDQLWHLIYFDACYTEIVRTVGYAGFYYRELWDKLQPLRDRFGQQRVESATYHLLIYEGQMTCNPKLLAEVRLREETRKLAWQLLGPPPEHPEYHHFQSLDAWKPSWERPETSQEEQPPKKRKRSTK